MDPARLHAFRIQEADFRGHSDSATSGGFSAAAWSTAALTGTCQTVQARHGGTATGGILAIGLVVTA